MADSNMGLGPTHVGMLPRGNIVDAENPVALVPAVALDTRQKAREA